MFGKHFSQMYEGSMRGAGSAFFAVWGYVISHMVPDRKNGTTVEMNAGIVGFLLGEEESVVSEQIERMCAPDPNSRTKVEDGKKLVRLSEYSYRVVNGELYRGIRNEEERREYQRQKQAVYRSPEYQEKKAKKTKVPKSKAAAFLGSPPSNEQSEERMQTDLDRAEKIARPSKSERLAELGLAPSKSHVNGQTTL